MREITFPQWIMFFFVYCFVGWCIESLIVSVQERRFVNRGFLRGPMLPIYGFGALTILFVTLPFKERPSLVYFMGMLGTTALEYVTAILMETIFKTRYWDYTGWKFNFQGRICLISSLFWGFLSLFLTDVLHIYVSRLVTAVDERVLIAADAVIGALMLADIITSAKAAVDMNRLLARVEEIRRELEKVMAQLKEQTQGNEHVAMLNEKMKKLHDDNARILEKTNVFIRSLIKDNPDAVSKKFNDALKDIRGRLEETRKGRRKK